ncbi:MAG: hypothetical protein J6R20_03790 [Clostridia bacterium]|nr:hypothetical protein [Clostridia bacterium]
MQKYKYLFCNCAIEFSSDEPIASEGDFSTFLSDFSAPDYSFRIIRTNELPLKTGDAVYVSDRRKVFSDGRTKLFTAYYNTKVNEFVDYACKIDNSELYIKSGDRISEMTVFDSINLPSVLLEKGIGILHCSFVEYQGYAILFSGNKQIGKSTQAALWKKYLGAETINGDRAALTVENGVVYANGIPFCGTSKICKNKKLPLKAVVMLSKGSSNELVRVSGAQAFMSLLGKFTYDVWNEDALNIITALTETVVNKVPVYFYSCLKEKSAVDVLESELAKIK